MCLTSGGDELGEAGERPVEVLWLEWREVEVFADRARDRRPVVGQGDVSPGRRVLRESVAQWRSLARKIGNCFGTGVCLPATSNSEPSSATSSILGHAALPIRAVHGVAS